MPRFEPAISDLLPAKKEGSGIKPRPPGMWLGLNLSAKHFDQFTRGRLPAGEHPDPGVCVAQWAVLRPCRVNQRGIISVDTQGALRTDAWIVIYSRHCTP